MISNLKPQNWFKSDIEINFELLGAKLEVGNGVISSCLKVPVLNDFAVMLSNYVKLISSPKIKEKTLEEMQDFFNGRMILHKDYFENVNEIKNAYHFAKDVLNNGTGEYSGKEFDLAVQRILRINGWERI